MQAVTGSPQWYVGRGRYPQAQQSPSFTLFDSVILHPLHLRSRSRSSFNFAVEKILDVFAIFLCEKSHLATEADVFCRTKRHNIALYHSVLGWFSGAKVAQVRAWLKANGMLTVFSPSAASLTS